MSLDLCKHLVVEKMEGGYVVRTPFRYQDNDSVVLVMRQHDGGRVCVSDGGDAFERLSIEGIDVDNERVQRFLSDVATLHGVHFDVDSLELTIQGALADAEEAVFSLAEVVLQVQALGVLRSTRAESDFRDAVMGLLRETASDMGIEMRPDATVLPGNHFTVDALLLSERPLAVVIASTTNRLLEAELLWSNVQRHGDPTRVIAVIESQKAVGLKQAERANHFTDKTLSYRDYEEGFKESLMTHVSRLGN